LIENPVAVTVDGINALFDLTL